MPRKKVIKDPNTVEPAMPTSKRLSRSKKICGPFKGETITRIPATCGFCQHNVHSLDDYGAHIVKKHLDQLKLCPKCSRAFISAEELKEHQSNHKEKQNSVSCSLCIIHFNSAALLERHDAAKHHNATPGVCLTPLLQYLSCHLHTSIIKLVRAMHKKANIICQMCKCEYSISNYTAHLKQCSGTPYVCDICMNVYTGKSNFLKHSKSKICSGDVSLLPTFMKVAKKKYKPKCSKCTVSFPLEMLAAHTKICNVFKCEPCSMTFDGINAYNSHYIKNHKESLKVRKCPHCPMEFIKKDLYEKHVKQHEKYKCVSCMKLFRTPKPLLLHLKSHKDVSPYICQLCDVNFKDGVDFKEHIIHHQNAGCVNFDENGYITYRLPKQKQKETEDLSASSSYQLSKDSEIGMTQIVNEGTETQKTAEETARQNSNEEYERDMNEKEQKKHEEDGNKKNEGEGQENSKEEEQKSNQKRIETVIPEIELKDEETVKTNGTETDNNAEKSADESMTIRTSRRLKKSVAKKSKVKIALRKRNKTVTESEESDDEPLIKKRRQKMQQRKAAYRCPLCRKGLTKLVMFNRHMHQHFKAGARQCVRCAKIFANASSRDKHYKECNEGRKTLNKLHQFLKERARQKMEKIRSQMAVSKPQTEKPAPPPPPPPFRIVLKKVAAPTFDIIQNGTFKVMNVKGVKVTEFFGTIPKNKIGDFTVKNYVENFQPEDAVHESKPFQTKSPSTKPLTTSRNLKIRSVRSILTTKMFKIRSRRFREPPRMEPKPGIRQPRPFKETRKDNVQITVNLVKNYPSEAPKLDYGVKHMLYEEEEGGDDEYGEYMHNDDDNVAEDVEVSSEPLQPKKQHVYNKAGGRFKVEVSAGEPSTEEIETKLAEVCRRLDVPVEKTSLHIGRLTTAAPYFQIVNVKQVLKKQKELKKQETMKKKFQQVKIGDAKMVPVNPLAHLMPKTQKPLNCIIDVTPIE